MATEVMLVSDQGTLVRTPSTKLSVLGQNTQRRDVVIIKWTPKKLVGVGTNDNTYSLVDAIHV